MSCPADTRPRRAGTAAEGEALRKEIAQLRHAVASHAAIDRAMGVVIAVGQLTPSEAFDVLRGMSMRTNTKLRTVADQVVDWAHTRRLPPALSKELQRQLHLRGRTCEVVPAAPPAHARARPAPAATTRSRSRQWARAARSSSRAETPNLR
ncbi:ANTAR domain-containing protein [Streptomyces aureocirculatus]|uniref:ANTAR domain-containing protein n=1 Tax=Streptomyces aureocirculatus TaxID=67275 RepID=UPI0007C4E61B|nr:ANTAR domain-containing protein [Streptomyces aureocirculatus]